MTLTELRYLVAVARERHFGRAAGACHVSQPTLSVAIRKLEHELGVTLFERGPSQVSVTTAGNRIVQQARRVLEETETLEQLAYRVRDPLAEPLRVGAIHTIGPYLFPELIPQLRDRAPSMSLFIHEDFTQRLITALRERELDVAIVALPIESAGLEVCPIHDEPFRVILPADHPWRELERIDPTRLAEEVTLLVGARHCFRDQVINACPGVRERAIPDYISGDALEGSSLETIRHMVATGMGISVVPCTATAEASVARSPVIVRRFSDPEPRRRVVLAWRRSFPRPAAVQALQDALRGCRLPGVGPVAADA